MFMQQLLPLVIISAAAVFAAGQPIDAAQRSFWRMYQL